MKKGKYSSNLLKTFISYFKPHRKIFALDMTCAFLVAAVDVAFPLVSRHAMYDLLPESLYKAFFTLMIIMVVAFAARAMLTFLVTYIGHTFGIRVEADIREDLYRHFQELEFDFYDRNRTGVLMSRLTSDLFELTELAHHGPEDVLISFITIAGALAVMFSVEWRLGLVVLLIVPSFLVVVILTRKNMMRASVEVKKKTAGINAEIESTLSGIKVSKAFDNAAIDYERFRKSNDIYKHSKSSWYKALGTFTATSDFFVCLLQIAVITAGGWLIMEGRMNYIDLVVFTLYISTFISPVRRITALSENIVAGIAGLSRFAEIMDTEPTITDAEDAVKLKNVKGDIRLDNVKFSYKDGTEVLHGISLDIKAGERVAVVGHSGGGKSTLCQLIPRFYDVDSGSISIDGNDIRKVTKSSLRTSVGIVQQDVFLFADTIFENIRYGRPDATMEEVVEAAKKAEIYDDIMAMEKGFDTYVGERGTLLSGGQKQRVSIARIFLKNPSVLILDEATSALDTITEASIQKSLDELSMDRTAVIIAHRLATIKSADRIVVIDNGEILEEGSHDELMKNKGLYARLYETQKLMGQEKDGE